MLRRDNKQRVVINARGLERADDFADRGVHVLDFLQQLGARKGRRILIAASGHARLVYGFSDIYRLKVHAEDRWHNRRRTRVRLARNLIQQGIYLDRVIALNVGEAAVPG